MDQKLTKYQKRILDFISAFTQQNGISPTYREIMSGVGLTSVSSVAEHVNNLIAKKVIKKVPNSARSLEIINDHSSSTVTLFQKRLETATPEETEILQRAAKILDLTLK